MSETNHLKSYNFKASNEINACIGGRSVLTYWLLRITPYTDHFWSFFLNFPTCFHWCVLILFSNEIKAYKGERPDWLSHSRCSFLIWPSLRSCTNCLIRDNATMGGGSHSRQPSSVSVNNSLTVEDINSAHTSPSHTTGSHLPLLVILQVVIYLS